MSLPQNPKSSLPYVDYIPAELRENKRWEVIYYVLDPTTLVLKRKSARVRPLKNKSERRKLGNRMVSTINKKLDRGWNPLIKDGETRGFTKFKDVAELYLSRIEKQVKYKDKRKDTLRAYTSYINNIIKYLIQIGEENLFVLHFDSDLIREYLDHVYYVRENSARTRNNYLSFINTFCEWMIKHNYLSVNPSKKIENISSKTKKRIIIPHEVKNEIFNFLKEENFSYLVLCQTCYYCLIRRTELTKLKVRDIILDSGIIYIEKSISKNKKSQPVTIPDAFLENLSNHIKDANPNDYVFSNDFKTGSVQLKPKKISDEWSKMRRKLNLIDLYQWYSLKDTGITNLLKEGVPLIAVRDQARHHSSIQTDAYTPREIIKANESIKGVSI